MIAAIETMPAMSLRPQDIENLIDELRAYHAIYSPLFQRRKQREGAGDHLRGLLLDIPRKSIEPMILALQGADANAVRAMQQFVSEGVWHDAPLLRRHWGEVDTTLGDEDGVLTLDGSDFLKQGQESVGVKRQYCAQWANGPIARLGSSWAMRASMAIPLWTGACICPKNGWRTRPMPTVGASVVSLWTWCSRPSLRWGGR